jgi:hypothetical protein
MKKIKFPDICADWRNLMPALFVSASLAAHSLPFVDAKAATFAFGGKCAFLFDSSYQDKCTALFDDDVLTLMPKGSRQVRILPQQIVFIALADKSSLKVNESLELYSQMVPWWQPWNRVPGWVKNASKEKAEMHQFSIGYVDKNFSPKIVLFVLDDKANASAMASELQSASGLRLGETRTVDRALDDRLQQRLFRDAQRQAQRLQGLCSQWMFEDAQPIADSLDVYVKNTSEEISIFDNSDLVVQKIRRIADNAFKYCDAQIGAEIAQARAEERARLAAIRKREADARAARAAALAAEQARANRAREKERLARRSAWDNLAG